MSGIERQQVAEGAEKHAEQRSEGGHEQHREQRLDAARDLGENRREQQASRERRSEIVEQAVRKDMPDTAEKRLTSAKDFHYRSDGPFEQELKRRDPSTTEGDARRTMGFHDPRDHQAFVREGNNTYETALHEKYHQKSRSDLPTHMNEGVTEYLAREKAGGIGNLRDIDHRGRDITPPKAYEGEVAAVRKMAATVGDGPIRAAYFEGKTGELSRSLDAAQGGGAYERLQRAVEREDRQGADRVFGKHS